MSSNITYIGTFLRIKKKTRNIESTIYGCPNHPNEYVNSIHKFCYKCGTELKDIIFNDDTDYHPTYHVPVELIDDVYEITSTENDEHIVISNKSHGQLYTNNSNVTSFKDTLDETKLINDFKTNHEKYLKWLDSEKFEYVIDFGVVEYFSN